MADWNRPPHGGRMNGYHDRDHQPWVLDLLQAVGRIEGTQSGIKDQLDQQDRRMIRQETQIAAIATDVAVLKSDNPTKPDRPWWKDLPVKELALLTIIGLSGLLGILQPAEVRSGVRLQIQKMTGESK